MSEEAAKIDILENALRLQGKLLDILLSDMTLKSDRHKLKNTNIIWATDSYAKNGRGYGPREQITREKITGENSLLIQPRAVKSKAEQLARTKDKAEVFTPLRIVAEMNSQLGRNLALLPEHDWRDYIRAKWLEITCGEAPFIVGRYNPTSSSGTLIKLENRVGFLDRKLQVISRKCSTPATWLDWAEIAYKSCYGYEWQGDNLLIARENLLYTLRDYYVDKFSQELDILTLEHFAEIISWNIFQMDGLKYVIPMSCKHTEEVVSEAPGLLKMLGEKDIVKKRVCEGCLKCDPKLHNGKKVKIMDWEAGRPILFSSLLKGLDKK